MADNSQGFRFEKRADENVLALYLYDQIGYWGVEASDVAAAIEEAGEVDAIHLYINSPGGSVFEGTAIMSLLKRQKVPKTVFVDGIAASMASLIAMEGDEIVIAEGGFMMIHNPAGGVYGEAKDFRKYAELLDMIKRSAIAAYSRRTKIAADLVARMMDEETWLDSATAIDMGFAGRLLKAEEADASARSPVRFDLGCFKNPPMELLAAGIEETLVPVNTDRWAKQDKELLCVSAGPIRDSIFDAMAGAALKRLPRQHAPEPCPVNPTEDTMDTRIRAAMLSVGLIDSHATKEAASCALSAWFAAQGRDVPTGTDEVIKEVKAGPQPKVPEGSVLLTEGELAARIADATHDLETAQADSLENVRKSTEDAVMARVRDILERSKMALMTIDQAAELVGLSVEEAKDRLIAQLCQQNPPVGPGGANPHDRGNSDPDAEFRAEYEAGGGQAEIGCTLEEYIDTRRRDEAGGTFA